MSGDIAARDQAHVPGSGTKRAAAPVRTHSARGQEAGNILPGGDGDITPGGRTDATQPGIHGVRVLRVGEKNKPIGPGARQNTAGEGGNLKISSAGGVDETSADRYAIAGDNPDASIDGRQRGRTLQADITGPGNGVSRRGGIGPGHEAHGPTRAGGDARVIRDQDIVASLHQQLAGGSPGRQGGKGQVAARENHITRNLQENGGLSRITGKGSDREILARGRKNGAT